MMPCKGACIFMGIFILFLKEVIRRGPLCILLASGKGR